jgi:polar amino acid transport system substrate-binding protein
MRRRKIMRKTVHLVALIVLVAIVVMAGQVFAAAKPAATAPAPRSAAAPAIGASVSPVIDRIVAKKELVVGTAATMPPLNMTTKDGQIIGFEADVAKIFASAMEVKLTLKSMHFDELLPALQAGTIDMVLSNMTMTPLRNLKVAFAGPYFESGKSILAKKANTAKLGSITDMNSPDKTLVALKGSTSQRFVEKLIPNAKLLLAEDYPQAVAMVREDKAMAMVADGPICLVSVYRYPDAGLTTLDKPLSYEPIGVALPANDPLLVNWVQNMILTIQKTGEMEILLQKWFKSAEWVKLLP